MANGKGPSTALQVAVIIFAILAVGLGVFTFYAYNQWNEEDYKKVVAQKITEYNNGRVNESTGNIARLVQIITGKEDSTPDAVKAALAQYKADMARASDTFSQFEQTDVAQQFDTRHGTLRNYRDTVHLLVSTIAATKSEVDDAAIGETKLHADRVTEITNLKRVANEEINAVAPEDEIPNSPGVLFNSVAEIVSAKGGDLEDTAEGIRSKTTQVTKDNDDLKAQFVRLTDVIAAARLEFEKKLDNKKKILNTLETATRRNKAEINRHTVETFEVADGDISWVNARSRTVWINLGRADKLTPQILFSVYPKDGTDVGRGQRKGAIEVTKILDERLAEARILEDSIDDPLLPGDKIYTPAWHPGRPEHISMCGFIDLDGDEIGDWELMYSLLRAAGAVLDQQQLPNYEIAGEQTAEQTRYLVLGAEPSKATNPKALANYSAIIKDADSKGIKTIPLKDFLAQIGFTELTAFKQFGLGSNPRDFDDVQRKSEESGKAANRFRQRNAPKRSDAGAYGNENR